MAEFEGNLFYKATNDTFYKARKRRQTSTEAEHLLWNYLRNRQFRNLKFRRQHPIGHLIADFYCHDVLLVIELDGDVHDTKEAKDYDAARTYEIEKHGISVIRFKNEQVFKNIEDVFRILDEYVNNYKKQIH